MCKSYFLDKYTNNTWLNHILRDYIYKISEKFKIHHKCIYLFRVVYHRCIITQFKHGKKKVNLV